MGGEGSIVDARAVLLLSSQRRAVKLIPTVAKMTLVKVLPREAQTLAPMVDEVLDNDAFLSAVARRLDDAVGPTVLAAARAGYEEPATARVLERFVGLGRDTEDDVRPDAGRVASLVAVLRAPDDVDALARRPVLAGLRVARAALGADDPRRAELDALAGGGDARAPDDVIAAWQQVLRGVSDAELADASACLVDGPCALVERALVPALLETLEEMTLALEVRVSAR